ncbi:unnamed protein product [Caenorhabditis auriculariae]|uniref:Protein kinase domain-containing protein n=1 Tax=Caenorhabditis auriculariae TaxID=2777116 RepID=A0A8S1HPL5_9PELO|nr:unnamed protein product [Caenorhabditis auriculariae]
MAPVKVAVKALLKDSANLNELSERMLDEARTMLRLRHEHVIGIYGWAIDKQPFMILIEMMESGSLDSFLLRKFDESNNSRLLKFALQAAKGLEYLHAMQFLHRDVAARNCLLSSDLTLKISDLGLATAGVFYFMTKAEKLPTRYLAPETLSTFVFVQATDFFCFGNLLYEIFSGGLMPYEELSSADARQKILNGEMNDLMKDRAQMREAVDFLKVLYKESKKAEGEPKTTTQETEQSLGNEDAEGVKKGRPPKKRRSKPIRRQELLEDLCPTQEETAQNED